MPSHFRRDVSSQQTVSAANGHCCRMCRASVICVVVVESTANRGSASRYVTGLRPRNMLETTGGSGRRNNIEDWCPTSADILQQSGRSAWILIIDSTSILARQIAARRVPLFDVLTLVPQRRLPNPMSPNPIRSSHTNERACQSQAHFRIAQKETKPFFTFSDNLAVSCPPRYPLCRLPQSKALLHVDRLLFPP